MSYLLLIRLVFLMAAAFKLGIIGDVHAEHRRLTLDVGLPAQ